MARALASLRPVSTGVDSTDMIAIGCQGLVRDGGDGRDAEIGSHTSVCNALWCIGSFGAMRRKMGRRKDGVQRRGEVRWRSALVIWGVVRVKSTISQEHDGGGFCSSRQNHSHRVWCKSGITRVSEAGSVPDASWRLYQTLESCVQGSCPRATLLNQVSR